MMKTKIILLLFIMCLVLMENVSGKLRKRAKRAWASFGPKPSNASCLFSCPTSWCYNGGTCSVSDYDCTFKCACVDGFTDSRCNTSLITDVTTPQSSTASDIDTTTLRPLSERTCLPGFVCHHGYCDRDSGIKCACDDGWSGLFCDKKEVCPLDCDDGSVCKRILNAYACVQTGQTETDNLSNTTDSNVTESVVSTAITPIDFIDEQTKPTTESTTLRNLADRTCMPGFVCEHGYCGQSGFPNCICDVGWTGPFCDKADCSPECDDDSECSALSGVPTCIAKPVISTTTTTTTSVQTTMALRDLADRTCVPGFVCEYGYCGQSGVPNCICDAGWKGPLCKKADCSPECDDNSDCKVLSGIPTCTLRTTTSPSTLQSTFLTSQTKPPVYNTTLRPLSERTCVPGFVCEHGYCPDGDIRCVCDPGWKEPFCEFLKCSPECEDDDDCQLVSGEPACLTESTSPSTKSTSTSPTKTTKSQTVEDDECPDFNLTMRPYTERECVPGYVCEYGYCIKDRYSEGMNSGINIECICDDGAYGPMCEYKCCLNCSEHGKCSVLNGTQVCLCEHKNDYKYTGKLCQTKVMLKDLKQLEEATWYMWVVGVCAFVLVLLIMVLVVMPYWMWRNRVTLVMKIVHFFQPYEDDDDRLWDAFISYKSSEMDEQFVLKQLYPKLEKELGFKLCMHQRDFIPGETIANNIINAVNNSRRTILVLTPRYVESEFTRFEYQMAQQEMLKKKHRIIPVLLEDITYLKESMDPNLKQIIGSVTYLEYPNDSNEKQVQKFWKKLELSLPKKRNISDSNIKDSVYLSSFTNEKIHISIIDSNSLKLEPLKKPDQSKSEKTSDVIILPIEDSDKRDKKEKNSSDKVLDVLKLPLEQNNPAYVEDIQLDIGTDENKNDKLKQNELDVKLNIEKYISMVEGTSC